MKKVLIILLLLYPCLVFGNGGPILSGNLGSGHIKPISSDSISIEDEKLYIDLKVGYAKVTVTYRLKNHGAKQDLTFGFPSLSYNSEYLMGPETEITDYEIKDLAEKIPATYVPGKEKYKGMVVTDEFFGEESSPVVGWYVSKLSFEKKETKKVTITYISNYRISGMSISEDEEISEPEFNYLTSFGSGWKGPVKKGEVVINTGSVGHKAINVSLAERFKKKGNLLAWNFKNLEPTAEDDIHIQLKHDYAYRTNYAGAGIDQIGFVKFDNKIYAQFISKNVTASSYLHDKTNELYVPKNVFSWSKEEAWVEGVKGPGVGEYVQIQFDNPVEVDKIGIANGFNKTRKLYYQNGRVKSCLLLINNTVKKKWELKDIYVGYSYSNPHSYQWIDLSDYKQPVKSIKIIITDVYNGSKYEDTCIGNIKILKEVDDWAGSGAR